MHDGRNDRQGIQGNMKRRGFLHVCLTSLGVLLGNETCPTPQSRTVADVTVERIAITEEFWTSPCGRKVVGLGEYKSTNLVYFLNNVQEQIPVEEVEVYEGDTIEWRDFMTGEIIIETFTVSQSPC
ncbi:MAG: hypothetical protein A3B74_03630 [Candidatus Kerfeldbacteria bacterium RIFCSPHIGHO2_02_FULL_42_14]|uniref:Uncharacterized protein n=1 Tax=Candidatus Kerfeldbacteria bacterium RIFCSPHIGHO2_02_FULL_42_14 TaxID=1798540 RepID=A0A1G2AQN6_9BACT|nr:MAG: hypothetical protein A3B74_03630 [Candidatus Kerfeldbacteria bacterium RIFCSPHIGHO2_02_FULL_42_14]OGY80608.1 MAG: hypothetical protein A3E60_04125 [Candidatus Kerfeldbacteria bacterium RIFCSPHIGHO2_12_FULL_42_13]OGY82532.1 MAG: hypothetical protein A3I91_03790 [Candidatus Kerfeldbacteria bacterium RIFCSPLOWO2_02_FULL_42_19]OGY87545.1 MAG: hypothetical protein A3G01_00805 [Candidatus Kerfeldbacteria bacterium RIFCSPLOWO2_12_FULL_43_9]